MERDQVTFKCTQFGLKMYAFSNTKAAQFRRQKYALSPTYLALSAFRRMPCLLLYSGQAATCVSYRGLVGVPPYAGTGEHTFAFSE